MATDDSKTTFSSDPIYSNTFFFEENFNPERARQWLREHGTNGFLFCGIYVFLIFSLQFYMRNKPRYELRRVLVLWNACLVIFSTLGTFRCFPELYHMVSNYGLYPAVCYPTVLEPIKSTEFWHWLSALSKLVELGDTVFIVLRKQPLIFLHWYHHVTVLLYTWMSYPQSTGYIRWFKTMNYTVHSFMYSYYTLRASGFSVPKVIMISITFSQIAQMVVGCTIVCLAFYYQLNEKFCSASNWNMVLAGCMYFSYLILFSKLFYNMYLRPPKKKYSSSSDSEKIKRK